MLCESLHATATYVPFHLTFRHASAVRARSASVLTVASSADGLRGYGEGCPRDYVSGESVESALRFIDDHRSALTQNRTVEELWQWIGDHESIIDRSPAAFASIEIALLDLMARDCGMPIERFLNLSPPANQFTYTAILGYHDMPIFRMLVRRYAQAGFKDFKLKTGSSPDRDLKRLKYLTGAVPALRLRVDANNSGSDPKTVIDFWQMAGTRPWAIEEPLRKRDFAGMARISEELDIPVILDESFCSLSDFNIIERFRTSWILNLRVSRAGGILRSVKLLREAANRGIPVIMGAHVGETGILTRAALTVSTAAPEAIIAREGAIGTRLLSREPFTPVLMFGEGGVLNLTDLRLNEKSGLGLQPVDDTGRRHAV